MFTGLMKRYHIPSNMVDCPKGVIELDPYSFRYRLLFAGTMLEEDYVLCV